MNYFLIFIDGMIEVKRYGIPHPLQFLQLYAKRKDLLSFSYVFDTVLCLFCIVL